MLTLMLATALAHDPAHVPTEATGTPHLTDTRVSDATMDRAEERFDRGARAVRTSQGLLWGGTGALVVGGGVAAVGVVGAAFVGGDGYVAMAVGGGAAALGGAGMVAASPAVVARGLHLERQALTDLGVQADRRLARVATATGIGGAAASFVFPPAVYGAALSSVSFSVAQHRVNERALATVEVAPVVAPDHVGVRLHGSF